MLDLILEAGCDMVEVSWVRQFSLRFRLHTVVQVFMGLRVLVLHNFHSHISSENALSMEILAKW